MREIKFRGKPLEDVDFDFIDVHIKKEDFVYGNLIQDGDYAYIVNGVVESTEDNLQLEQWIRVRPETVGQFTGLKDKNGKEIYEGDVVELIDSNNRKLKCNVEYITGSFWYVIQHNQLTIGMWEYHNFGNKSVEVIGTIHDKEDV